MLDLVAAVFFTAYFAAQLALLVGFAAVARPVKLAAVGAAGLWLAIVAGLYARGGVPAGVSGPVPANFAPFALALAVLVAAWLLAPHARQALLSVPLPALVALHIGRVGGLLFITLYLQGRLSAPFGPVAGLGDVITGASALALAPLLALGWRIPHGWLRAWNAFGALDLVVAITLAALSVPGTALRVFTDGAGAQVMGTLPWTFVPAILVPIDLLAHLVIAAKLKPSKHAPRRQPALEHA